MKTKLVKVLGIMLVALFMVSCGEKETITSKKVKATGVYGDNADLISIVDDTCTLNKKDGRLRVKAQLKLEKKANNDVAAYPVIVLKDEDYILDVKKKLEPIFENIMEIVYDNSFTQTNNFSDMTLQDEKLSPLELFKIFYEKQNNKEMNKEQIDIIKDIFKDLNMEENV